MHTVQDESRLEDGAAGAATNVNTKPTSFELEEHPLDDHPGMSVAVIGAGLSGITAGILLPAKVPGIKLTIYEKNADVGGVWLENVYPGIRCDVPAHVYQSTFEPNTQWSEDFPEGAEICTYWQRVARKHNVYQHLRLRTKVQQATWSAQESQWTLQLEDLLSGNVYHETADVVIAAIGHFNSWRLPSYPGLEGYQGHLRHSSNWDPSFNPKGKRVAVIGNGASGLQLVPEIQKVAARLDHYARSSSWVAGSLEERTQGSTRFTTEQLQEFQDPQKYLEYRKSAESKIYKGFAGIFKDTKENHLIREDCINFTRHKLQDRPEMAKRFMPEYPPTCRRLAPSPGYLEALVEENVEFIQTPIEKFTAHGIQTVDGEERPVDAIICCTGANPNLEPPFSIVANGVDLREAWAADGSIGFPYTYLGIAAPSHPNLLFLLGPHGKANNGSALHAMENQVVYFAKLIRKMQKQRIASMVPSRAATDDFVEYCDTFFRRTVLTEPCRSWYNSGRPGGRINGVWPGSGTHLNRILQDPQWEDWECTYRNPAGNRFAFWGNGWTAREKDEAWDASTYLRSHPDIDLSSYLEG